MFFFLCFWNKILWPAKKILLKILWKTSCWGVPEKPPQLTFSLWSKPYGRTGGKARPLGEVIESSSKFFLLLVLFKRNLKGAIQVYSISRHLSLATKHHFFPLTLLKPLATRQERAKARVARRRDGRNDPKEGFEISEALALLVSHIPAPDREQISSI